MKAYKINQFIGSNLYGSFLVETEENAKKAVELANKHQGDGIKLVYAGEVEAERKNSRLGNVQRRDTRKDIYSA